MNEIIKKQELKARIREHENGLNILTPEVLQGTKEELKELEGGK